MALKELVVALFVLGAVLLSWPFLTMFNVSRAVLGIALLVFYLFRVWAAITGGRAISGHLQQALEVASVAQAGEVDGIRLELAALHFVVGER